MCAAKGLAVPATVADHIEPHHGDWHSFLNGELQSLCDACHNSTKRFEEIRGYSNEIGDDGWPIDPRHPANGGVPSTVDAMLAVEMKKHP
jgi:5-methylcytosine-specific restriction enzyme A